MVFVELTTAHTTTASVDPDEGIRTWLEIADNYEVCGFGETTGFRKEIISQLNKIIYL